MITVNCDHCKEPIKSLVIALQFRSTESFSGGPAGYMGSHYTLHTKCVEPWAHKNIKRGENG